MSAIGKSVMIEQTQVALTSRAIREQRAGDSLAAEAAWCMEMPSSNDVDVVAVYTLCLKKKHPRRF